MSPISIPDDFDFSAAFKEAVMATLAPAGELERLKHRPFLTGKEVSILYGIPESSLRTWRCRGGGPKYYQPHKGGTALYEHDDIRDFMRNNHIKG